MPDTMGSRDRHELILHRVAAIGRMVPVVDRRVLCIGFEACSLAQALATRGATTTGADADHVVEVAPGQPARHHSREPSAPLTDLTHRGLFDTALVVEAVNSHPSPRTLLRHVLSAVRPGGLVFVQDLRGDAPRPLLEERLRLTDGDQRANFLARVAAAPDHDDLRAIFADLGPLVTQTLPLNPAPPATEALWAAEERLAYRYLLCRAHA